MAFIGHIILRERIKMDRQDIEVVKKWPRPITPTNFRSFVGLAGYYERFVESLSSIVVPLTKLTQKKVKSSGSILMREVLRS